MSDPTISKSKKSIPTLEGIQSGISITPTGVWTPAQARPNQADSSEPHEAAFNTWKTAPSPENLRATVNSLAPTIEQALTQYVGAQVPTTVKHRAHLMAAQAVQSFKAEKGANLKTHVYRQLQTLQRLAPEISDPLPAPERFRRQSNEIAEASRQFSDDMGRDPTDEELAELIQQPLARVVKVRSRMRAKVPMSKLEVGDDGDTDEADITASSNEPYDDWVHAVYHELGDHDKLIMMHRTGYRNAEVLDNNAIAKMLRLTPAAVSARAKRIQQRLDKFYG